MSSTIRRSPRFKKTSKCWNWKTEHITQASIQLHAHPGGIGFGADKDLGTDKHVFSILGPHFGHYYGDVILVFKREILHHPDADFYLSGSHNCSQWQCIQTPSMVRWRSSRNSRTRGVLPSLETARLDSGLWTCDRNGINDIDQHSQ